MSSSQYWSRRIIWLLLAVVVAIFVIRPIHLRMYVSPPAYSLYQAVEHIPKGKLLVITADWEAGTKGENEPQAAALMRHALKRRIPFALLGINYPAGPTLSGNIAKRLAAEYGRRYGVDWVNWGFLPGGSQAVIAWARDIPRTVIKDAYGTPLNRLPIMKGVRDIKDIGLLIDVTPSSTVPIFIDYIYGIYRTPIGYACTGVMAPEAFPYLDSGQLVGLLKGLTGAAEYETLVGHPDQAMRRMAPQSFAHLLVIALIIVGNVVYFRSRRRRDDA